MHIASAMFVLVCCATMLYAEQPISKNVNRVSWAAEVDSASPRKQVYGPSLKQTLPMSEQSAPLPPTFQAPRSTPPMTSRRVAQQPPPNVAPAAPRLSAPKLTAPAAQSFQSPSPFSQLPLEQPERVNQPFVPPANGGPITESFGQRDEPFNQPTDERPSEPQQGRPAVEELPAPGRHVIGFGSPTSGAIKMSKSERGLNLVVREQPIAQVVSALAEAHDLNLVMVANATKTVTLSLYNVTLDQALTATLAAGGLNWSQQDGVLYVSSPADAQGMTPRMQGKRVAVFELDYASAEDADLAVKGLLSPVGSSWVIQKMDADNRRTKESITVEDLPSYLDRIQSYLFQIDQPPRQVLIEAHILEVELGEDTRHGVNFNYLADMGGVQMRFRTTGFANPAAPQAFFLESTATNLTAVLEALRNTTDAKTLASPRIVSLNGQQSRIQVGEQLGYRVTTTTETSTLESVEFLNVGVVLTVTPQIARDGRVLMRIKPEVSSGTVDPNTGLPSEDTTELETDILLADGHGIVIGGLIREIDSVGTNAVIGLGDLSFLGPLFKRRVETKSRKEVVVALIPHVLPANAGNGECPDINFQRARDPLFHGQLEKYPRPYEARMPDAQNRCFQRFETRVAAKATKDPYEPQAYENGTQNVEQPIYLEPENSLPPAQMEGGELLPDPEWTTPNVRPATYYSRDRR